MSCLRCLRRGLKRSLGALLGWIAGGWLVAGKPGRPLPEPIRAVLVVRIDERVGNVLLTTPLLRSLTEGLPGARIDALVAASKVPLVRGLGRIVPFEKRSLFVRPWAFLCLLWQLRAARYDVVIDASHWHHFSLSSALLLAWTGAPVRIAHERGQAQRYATHTIAAPDGSPNEIAVKLRLLEPLGIADKSVREMSTPVGLQGQGPERMKRWLADLAAEDQPLVGLAPGARKPDHRMPLEAFARLGRRAIELGARPLILWGPGEEGLAQGLAEQVDAVMAPPTDLEELATLMRACRAVITNDTGPMHLSVACGAPTIALFLSSDPQRWGHPYGANAMVAADGRALDEVVEQAERALVERLG